MMASDPIIEVENLSKRYLLGHEAAGWGRYSSLRETLMRDVRRLGRKALDMARGRQLL